MAENEGDQPIEWGHLHDLYKASIPSQDNAERDLGFEQIGIIEKKLAYLDERLASKKSRSTKLQKARRQREELQMELAQLKAGHEEGAKVLRKRAQSLALLPREMRDAIFEQIYVQQDTVPVSWYRHGPHWVFNMPKDPALYMSSLHVGEHLAREASEIFYKRNVFTFVFGSPQYFRDLNPGLLWSQTQLDDWFNTDHYGSGITPKDMVRNLDIRMDRSSRHYDSAVYSGWGYGMPDKICNHVQLEELSRQVERGSWQDCRGLLLSLKQYATLQHIQVTIADLGGRFDCMTRLLNPAVHELKDAGIKVTFKVSNWNNESLDFSTIFDPPSDGDFAEYYQVSQRNSVFRDDPYRDVFDTWQVIDSGRHNSSTFGDEMTNKYSPADGKLGFMRVWLFEHHEMHKFLSREYEMYKVVEEMAQGIKHLSDDERALRRRFYPRLLEHVG